LAGTDYGSFLANEPSPLSVSVIDDKLREKLVVEFQHMRNHSVEPLSQFLDFITYSYMIDNIILLITGTLHQRPISELIPKCHPLGSFEQMEAIHVAATPAELYNAVLVDTPLGMILISYFSFILLFILILNRDSFIYIALYFMIYDYSYFSESYNEFVLL